MMTLTGIQKAAVLLASLPQEQSSKMLQRLAPDEVERLMRELVDITTVSASVVEGVLTEFVQVANAVDSVATGGLDRARELLESALGPQAAQGMLARLANSVSDSGMRRLKRASPDVLYAILRGEHPQTIALILTHLDPAQAAGVVEIMEPHHASDVLHRIGTMERVAPEMLPVVEAGLANKADVSLNSEFSVSGGPDVVAQLLTRTSPSLEKLHLEAIGKVNPDLASEIASRMFVFEDLRLLDARSMASVLNAVDDQQTWALAMKNASEELREHIFSNMTERRADMLRDALESTGRTPVREVEQAQSLITTSVRSLEQNGDVIIPGRGKGDGFIE